MSANIRDFRFELGVLRSMGMTKNEVNRVIMYEGLCNNLSSMLMGFTVGIIIAAALAA